MFTINSAASWYRQIPANGNVNDARNDSLAEKKVVSNTSSKVYQLVINFPWKVYFALMSLIAVKPDPAEGTPFYRLKKDLEAYLNRGPVTSFKCYQADKNLASRAWLMEHKDIIKTNLQKRLNGDRFTNDAATLWVGRILNRLNYSPEFAQGKIPYMDEKGSLTLISIKHRLDYTVEKQYCQKVLNYVLQHIEDPLSLENLAYNSLYETVLWKRRFWGTVMFISCVSISVFTASRVI